MSNNTHLAVATRHSAAVPAATHHCVLGRDIIIRPQELQDYCATLLRDVEHDLVVVCGAVVLADRSVVRRRASGWPRDMELTIPVSAPDRWNDPAVARALVEALEYVTGDNWQFNFVEGGETVTIPQSTFGFDEGPYAVVPFSDGMDSFLQWQLLSVEEPGLVPLRIQTSGRGISEARSRRIDAAGTMRDRRLRLPVRWSVGNHPEPTYRTRTFLFFCMAALAAAKLGATRVVIGENGVGALGPSLIQYGNECPHRTTHPAFTRRLRVFVNALLGSQVVFEHPQLWRTKGEVLIKAKDLGITGWERTNSCVRNPRDRLGGLPCGVCPGCLLRRTALVAAGCDAQGFFWQGLSSGSLDASRSNLDGREAKDNDRDIMGHAAHAMDELAALAALPADAEVFLRGAWEVSGPVPRGSEAVAAKIHRLVGAHAREWAVLRASFGDARLLDLETVG